MAEDGWKDGQMDMEKTTSLCLRRGIIKILKTGTSEIIMVKIVLKMEMLFYNAVMHPKDA